MSNRPGRPTASVTHLRATAPAGLPLDAAERPRLTDKQRRVLDFIEAWHLRHGYPPTLREIGSHFGIRSTNAVNDHLRALERKGYLVRDALKSRSLRAVGDGASRGTASPAPSVSSVPDVTSPEVLPGPRASNIRPLARPGRMPTLNARIGRLVTVPVVGRVAAGLPIPAIEEADETIQVDSFLLGNEREVFALRVVGESMIGDAIYPGDFIFVRRQPWARPGDIVVALIEDDATVKRYYPEGDRIRFQPSNPTMEPIYVHRSEFRETMLIGVVVGLYRRI